VSAMMREYPPGIRRASHMVGKDWVLRPGALLRRPQRHQQQIVLAGRRWIGPWGQDADHFAGHIAHPDAGADRIAGLAEHVVRTVSPRMQTALPNALPHR